MFIKYFVKTISCCTFALFISTHAIYNCSYSKYAPACRCSYNPSGIATDEPSALTGAVSFMEPKLTPQQQILHALATVARTQLQNAKLERKIIEIQLRELGYDRDELIACNGVDFVYHYSYLN